MAGSGNDGSTSSSALLAPSYEDWKTHIRMIDKSLDYMMQLVNYYPRRYWQDNTQELDPWYQNSQWQGSQTSSCLTFISKFDCLATSSINLACASVNYLRQAHQLSHNLYNNNVMQYSTIHHGIRCNYILDFNTNHPRNELCTPWRFYLGEERKQEL